MTTKIYRNYPVEKKHLEERKKNSLRLSIRVITTRTTTFIVIKILRLWTR